MGKRSGIILAIIGYIVFFFCVEGWGANWIKYCTIPDGDKFHNAEGITRQPNGIARVWEKLIYSDQGKADYIAKFGIKGKDISYTVVLKELDCKSKRSRLLSLVTYSEVGGSIGVIASGTSPEPVEWDYIVPDSVEEVLFNIVCK